ncbi:para-nitrobenzyl esterase [Fusarium beomiforme]|uniref:Para-nitrobenzyl esterase n=1 Tax=Fusarium beomiforme TaxID=44412 RepID=A0A9P5A889_9HYPO|nr:para-nitrobenzyl esterase [Fusarium beomiforme]
MFSTLEHPLLGHVKGLKAKTPGVVQYLGIPYATLAHRFAAPELKSDHGGTIDATKRGCPSFFRPSVIRPPVACDIEFGLIQKALDNRQDLPISDLDGLNLDIVVPEAAVKEHQASLPVLVWIHGGGYIIGDTGLPHCDLGPIVAYSQSIGKPIIGVAINYRLGVPGFLDSDELRATGAPANRGLLDQKVALQWLRQNISGFSGDLNRITAIGQSAGASAVMHLLDSESPEDRLFYRAICLGGNNLAVPSLPRHVAQDTYKAILQCLGIDSNLSGEDQVAALTSVPPEELLSKVPMSIPLLPVVEMDKLASFQAVERQKSSSQHRIPLMIGSADFDGVIFGVLGLFTGRDEGSIGQEFVDYFMRTVPAAHHDKVKSLLSQYGISTGSEANDQVRTGILEFGTDLKYFASSKHYASFWPAESWLYYFNESNPWDGPHKGRSCHCLDIAYLFLNYSNVMNQDQKETGKRFANEVIEFTNGEAPWAEFKSSGKIRVYGSHLESKVAEITAKELKEGPSLEVQALWEDIGLDNLGRAWDAYAARL